MNIVDSLYVTLGLDGSGFARGAKQATDTSGKLRENIVSDNTRQTDATKKFQDGIRSVKTEALGLLLVLGGAASIKAFAGNIIAGDAATGRLANNLGVATEKLSAWEQAVQRVGGSKGDIDGTLSNLSSTYLNAKVRGDLSKSGELAGLGMSYGDLKDPTTALLKLADAKDRMTAPVYRNRLTALGIDQNTINLLEKGRGAVEAYLREAEKNGVVTQRNAEDAQKFEAAMSDLTAQIKGAARPEIEALANAFSGMAKDGKAAGLVLPAIEGGVVAIGVAATVAYAPVVALAAAFGALIVAYQDWQRLRHMSAAERKQFDNEGQAVRDKARAALGRGDLGGAAAAWWEGVSERVGNHGAAPQAAAGSGGDSDASYLQQHGLSAEQARGVVAGIHAEGGGLGMAANGAFGIGQWRGSRLRGLISRYGRRPSRQQQLEYLAWELNGGDKGGASVRSAKTATDALSAYVGGYDWGFMRPGAGRAEDMRRGMAFLGGDPRALNASKTQSSSSSQATTIHGGITINTAATDARGIARDLPSALRERGIVYQTQTGVQP